MPPGTGKQAAGKQPIRTTKLEGAAFNLLALSGGQMTECWITVSPPGNLTPILPAD